MGHSHSNSHADSLGEVNAESIWSDNPNLTKMTAELLTGDKNGLKGVGSGSSGKKKKKSKKNKNDKDSS